MLERHELSLHYQGIAAAPDRRSIQTRSWVTPLKSGIAPRFIDTRFQFTDTKYVVARMSRAGGPRTHPTFFFRTARRSMHERYPCTPMPYHWGAAFSLRSYNNSAGT
jgi:hypothetical protein